MAVVINGRSYVDRSEDMAVSGVSSWGWNGSRTTRTYDFNNSGNVNSDDIATDFLGRSLIATLGGYKWVQRYVPHSLKERNSNVKPYLFAVSMEQQGMSPNSELQSNTTLAYPWYNQIRNTVKYETLPFNILADNEMPTANGVPDESTWKRYVTKIAKPAGEFFTINPAMGGSAGVAYRWVGTGPPTLPVKIGISKLISFCNLQVTWHQVPEDGVPSVFVNPNLTARSYIESTIGCVNSTDWNGYTAGTLLLLGVEMKPNINPFGDRCFDITYMFKFFNPGVGIGHNYLYYPVTPAYTEVTTSGSSNLGSMTPSISIYDWAEFRNLFRPV